MSTDKFNDDCPDCRPMLFEPSTQKALPQDDPIMIIVNKLWFELTREERESFHHVCCKNSRDPVDVQRFQAFWLKVKEMAESAERAALPGIAVMFKRAPL